jgi:hypothetical protein
LPSERLIVAYDLAAEHRFRAGDEGCPKVPPAQDEGSMDLNLA